MFESKYFNSEIADIIQFLTFLFRVFYKYIKIEIIYQNNRHERLNGMQAERKCHRSSVEHYNYLENYCYYCRLLDTTEFNANSRSR